MGLAFLLAATAAVGEEIAFRGALQPVLGFLPTAIIFAMTHIQYTLTPAWLIIFGVALAFGWIRKHYNTTVSILTHFLYNFIPLAQLRPRDVDIFKGFCRIIQQTTRRD
jgi:membrane protease YdiL (CAAX protease family)